MIKKQNNSGFTLIELLVVIAIIAVLSAVVTGTLQNSRTKAQNTNRLSDIDQIHKAFEVSFTKGPEIDYRSIPTGFAAGTNYCIGGTSTLTDCWASAAVDPANLNSTIQNGYPAGISLPKDPVWKNTTNPGSTYYYTKRSGGINSPTVARGNCVNTTTCPAGTYLLWYMDKKGQSTSLSLNCGRGILLDNATTGLAAGKYSCVLRIGNY